MYFLQSSDLFLGGLVPPLYTGFPGVHASVRASVVRPKNGLVGPIKELCYYTVELTMTMKLKVDGLNEQRPKQDFFCMLDLFHSMEETQNGRVGPII